jgi:hypothetical protein
VFSCAPVRVPALPSPSRRQSHTPTARSAGFIKKPFRNSLCSASTWSMCWLCMHGRHLCSLGQVKKRKRYGSIEDSKPRTPSGDCQGRRIIHTS